MASSNDYVYCMFGIKEKNSPFSFSDEQREKLLQEYDTVLLILDSEEFIRRITKSILERGFQGSFGFVHYYRDSMNLEFLHCVQKDPSLLAMHKRRKYAYQQEYRFVVRRKEHEKNCRFKEFCIGDISDISEVYEANSFFETFHAECEGMEDERR